MAETMTRAQGAQQFREDLRAEGKKAREAGVPIARCPYANTGLRDQWGVNEAAEWLRGWHDMTMVDRMARALAANDPIYARKQFELLSPVTQEVFRSDARAALHVMREPTLAILRSMRDTVPVDGFEWIYVDADAPAHWSGMIDAALEEG